MHKSTQDTRNRLTSGSCSCSELPLDTSEQVPPDTSQGKIKKNLEKRARAKFITNIVASPLSKLRSPLEKAYKLTERCSGELTETPGKLTGLYCGCRWCLVCSRIRTARLITGYMPSIQAMAEKWFLTLSRPNVVGAQLEAEIKYYLRSASLIQRHLREKLGLDYSSLRKIECTYNEEVNTYHPHFHFIFDSQEAAQAFLDEWLSRNPTAKLDKGNQLKRADDNSVLELFKYFTKVVSKSKSKTANGTQSSDYRIHLQALDTMFVAMRAVRTFQPCGVVKSVSEEVEPEQALESGRAEVNHWKWLKYDWVNIDTAQALTGYLPAPGIQDIANHLVYPAGVVVEGPADFVPYYVDKGTGEVVPNEKAHLVRGEWGYTKIYPYAPGSGSARREPCRLVAVPWEDVQAHQLPESAEPVAAAAASVQLGLFSEVLPPTALAAARRKVLVPARPLVASSAEPILALEVDASGLPAPSQPSSTPGRAPSSAPVRKVSRPVGLSIATPLDYFRALTSDSLLFTGANSLQ